ncbi:MAG: histidine phosphatase family protein [Chloroflexota bacterium]|nr:histidine phosphatase family protein [Chloroflexota bacterium]
MELILVRHGETDANRQGKLMGSFGGPSLNPTGRAQADDIAAALKAEPVAHIYTSPAHRARETAEIVSRAIGVPFSELNDFSEIDVGRMVGLTSAELRQQFPVHYLEWEQDPATARHPGGETMLELQERTWGAAQALAGKYGDRTVVVVSHLFAILTVVTRVLEMPLRGFRRIRLEPGAMVRIEPGPDKSEVLSANETWHLRTRGQDAWASASGPDKPC